MKILTNKVSLLNSEFLQVHNFICIPDSALIRNNENFYIPNFSQDIHAQLGIYIKITKIGKCIELNFIHRYFSEAGVFCNFIANKGEADVERGFDKSLAISNAMLDFSLIKNVTFSVSENTYSYITEDLTYTIFEWISALSFYYTFKIGDIICIPLSSEIIKTTPKHNSLISNSQLDFVCRVM